MLNKLRKNNKKGFTLVELIVVLVILAILAALLIPALTGYIDKAKERQIIAETRQAVMAAQTLADEIYAVDSSQLNNTWLAGTASNGSTNKDNILNLAELDGNTNNDITSLTFDPNDGSIATLVFTDGTYTCTYDATTNPKYNVQ